MSSSSRVCAASFCGAHADNRQFARARQKDGAHATWLPDELIVDLSLREQQEGLSAGEGGTARG